MIRRWLLKRLTIYIARYLQGKIMHEMKRVLDKDVYVRPGRILRIEHSADWSRVVAVWQPLGTNIFSIRRVPLNSIKRTSVGWSFFD